VHRLHLPHWQRSSIKPKLTATLQHDHDAAGDGAHIPKHRGEFAVARLCSRAPPPGNTMQPPTTHLFLLGRRVLPDADHVQVRAEVHGGRLRLPCIVQVVVAGGLDNNHGDFEGATTARLDAQRGRGLRSKVSVSGRGNLGPVVPWYVLLGHDATQPTSAVYYRYIGPIRSTSSQRPADRPRAGTPVSTHTPPSHPSRAPTVY
jgi:hypothetical protein